jgi:N-acetylmuramoyl-L-alanine amidase
LWLCELQRFLIKNLAKKGLDYWRGTPATKALYFQNPGRGKECKNRFWGKLAGRYKNHCFYNPDKLNGCGL